jgi:hypothetical protein
MTFLTLQARRASNPAPRHHELRQAGFTAAPVPHLSGSGSGSSHLCTDPQFWAVSTLNCTWMEKEHWSLKATVWVNPSSSSWLLVFLNLLICPVSIVTGPTLLGSCGSYYGRAQRGTWHKVGTQARCQWLMSVILATQEAEIRKSWFKASPGK